VTNICPQCGAPAEHFEPEVTQYACHFCSTEYEVRHPKREELLRKKEARERQEAKAREREEREKQKEEREKEKKSSDRIGALVPILTVGSILGLAGGMTYYEEYVKPGQWDGHSSYSCSKGSFTFTNVQATSSLTAKGNCTVTLVNPAFEAALKASDHGVINVTGGRIHYSSTAVDASGFAKITLNGTTIDGKVSSTGSAVVESKNAKINGKVTSDGPSNLVNFPAPLATSTSTSTGTSTSTSTRRWDPGSKACTGITSCYKTYTGQIQGHLVANIDAHGDVGNVSYTGNATADQKKCLTDLAKTHFFTVGENPLPGAGQLICDYAGTVTPGTQMMSQNGSFVPGAK
jgi:hypothetical protein